MTPDPASDRLFARLTWAVAALGLLARLVRFVQPFPLWGDEVFVTQNFLDRDFRTILNQLDNGQICPPLFLWAQLAAFKLFGGGEQAMRLVPLVAGVLGMVGFARLAMRLLPAFPAFLAVGFLSVAIWPVHLSTFAKPYSFDLLAAVAVLSVAVHWHDRPASIGRGLLFALVLPVSILASYTAAFVAGGASLALLLVVWKTGWSARVLFALTNLGVAGAFAFVLTVGTEQLDGEAVPIKDFLYGYWRDGFPPNEWWKTPVWLIKGVTGRMFAYPVGDGNGGSTITFLAAVIGGWAWWRTFPRWPFVLLVTPIGLNLVAAAMWKYPFGACGRLSQYAAPAICLFAGLGATTFLGWLLHSARAFRIAAWAYAVAFAGLGVGYVVSAVLQPYHDLEAKWTRDTIRQFEKSLRPDEAVVMRPAPTVNVPMPKWYFRLMGDRVSWGGRWAVGEGTKRVWVVDFWQKQRGEPHTPPPLTVPPGWTLTDVIGKHFVPTESGDEPVSLNFERYERRP